MRKQWLAIILPLVVLISPPLRAPCEEILNEVFLLLRERELLGFSSVGNRWVAINLRSGERVLESKYAGHVAVVVTNVRVLGFSTLISRWAEEKLVVGESMVTFEEEGNVGAVVTNLRAFGFSARTATWSVRQFELK